MDEDDIMMLGELLGLDDDDVDDDLGARRGRGAGPARSRARVRARIKSALATTTPGVPKPGGRKWPLGFTVVQFAAATALTIAATATPQKPFKGYEFKSIVTRTGATATGLVTIASFLIGSDNQMISADPIPAEMFGPDATNTGLAVTEVTPGIIITIPYTISVLPGAADTVDVGTGFVGLSLA